MEEDNFDCERQEQLRRDLEIARSFFGDGALQSGMIQNPKIDEIREPGGNVKSEAGNRPFDDQMDAEIIDDDDDIEIEIEPGVFQTASGHLIV